MKHLNELTKAEKAQLLEQIVSGDIEYSQLGKDTVFAETKDECFIILFYMPFPDMDFVTSLNPKIRERLNEVYETLFPDESTNPQQEE